MNPTPIILDCDPGHDDAIALLLAVAVTADYGGGGVEDDLRRAIILLEPDDVGVGIVPLEIENVL